MTDTANTNDDSGADSDRLCVVSEFWEMPGDPVLCPDLRHRVRDSLIGFPHAADDAELVVAELFANACRHSVSGQGGKVSVSLSGLRTGLVLVSVADEGPRPDPVTGRPRSPQVRPDVHPFTVGGRGLRLVAALSTDWGRWTTEDGGHAVWAVFEPPLPAFTRCRRPW